LHDVPIIAIIITIAKNIFFILIILLLFFENVF